MRIKKHLKEVSKMKGKAHTLASHPKEKPKAKKVEKGLGVVEKTLKRALEPKRNAKQIILGMEQAEKEIGHLKRNIKSLEKGKKKEGWVNELEDIKEYFSTVRKLFKKKIKK